MALGAQRDAVLKLVLRQGTTLVGIGVAAGVAAAVMLTRYLESMLYDLGTLDVTTFAVVAAAFAAVALVAAYVPARRATAIDPLAALRYE
jgi:putative ABC transport system permease protein